MLPLLRTWGAAGVLACLFAWPATGCSDLERSDASHEDPWGHCPNEGGCSGGPTDCSLDNPCFEDYFCNHWLNSCGENPHDSQQCALKRHACPAPENDRPICGCDGRVYATSCEAVQQGIDMAANEHTCATPPGMFMCGGWYCRRDTEYCHINMVETNGGAIYGHLCTPLPASCEEAAGCACLSEICDGACDGDPVAGIRLTCPTEPT